MSIVFGIAGLVVGFLVGWICCEARVWKQILRDAQEKRDNSRG